MFQTALRRKLLIGALALPLVAGGFALQDRTTRDGARLFDQVMSLVSDRFVDTVNNAELYEKAARGLVQQLNDPYSELLTPRQMERFQGTSSGRYGGVGMQIENQAGAITVVKVFPHTPAERAGVVEGDRIVGVDTASTRGWSVQQVSDALTGRPGTRVRARFMRPGVPQVIEHTLTRAEINVPAVPYTLMLDGQVGYIALQSFNEHATSELQASVERLTRQGARSIVLDLRGNPGGILEQGLNVADLFLREGQQIASIRGRQGMNQTFNARQRQHYPDMPLVVMLNGYSASASEIVAGALQDHDRALVVGNTSFGKGLVQSVYQLQGGYALKLTTAKWFTPAGRTIQKERVADPGVAGDDEGMPEPDSLETAADVQDRPVYRSTGGRVLRGGGGITPDVVVPEDTNTTAEQEFARAVAPKAGIVRATLYTYGLELRETVRSPNFTVRPEWRDEYFRRLAAAGVQMDRRQYDAAAPMIDRMIGDQVARFAFGDSTAFRRQLPSDPQMMRALEMLRRSQTQRDLFTMAQASRPADDETRRP
jgi:carboxyl-terminal processing protease